MAQLVHKPEKTCHVLYALSVGTLTALSQCPADSCVVPIESMFFYSSLLVVSCGSESMLLDRLTSDFCAGPPCQ